MSGGAIVQMQPHDKPCCNKPILPPKTINGDIGPIAAGEFLICSHCTRILRITDTLVTELVSLSDLEHLPIRRLASLLVAQMLVRMPTHARANATNQDMVTP